ncbi:MAG: hypothetical protein Q4G67_05890 [Actinomycetia bacterium]|nr:hypothetical protein [Actinomycetes bacterium]
MSSARPSTSSRSSALAALAATLAVALGATLSAPSGQSAAQWRDGVQSAVSSAQTGTMSLEAADATAPAEAAVSTSPQIRVANSGAHHSGTVTVTDTQISQPSDPAALAGDGPLEALRRDVSVTYRIAPAHGSCADLGAAGSALPSVRIGPSGDATSTQTLCPQVRHATTDSSALLRNVAGRAVDIRSTLRLEAAPPATTHSPEATAVSQYRVAFPRPTAPGRGAVCRSGIVNHGEIYWAWPDSSGTTSIATPAVAWWELLVRRKDSADAWSVLRVDDGLPFRERTAVPSQDRSATMIQSDHLDRIASRGTWMELKVRAYPFAGSPDYYVESDWVQDVRNAGLIFTRWECGGVRANPDQAQPSMPWLGG